MSILNSNWWAVSATELMRALTIAICSPSRHFAAHWLDNRSRAAAVVVFVLGVVFWVAGLGLLALGPVLPTLLVMTSDLDEKPPPLDNVRRYVRRRQAEAYELTSLVDKVKAQNVGCPDRKWAACWLFGDTNEYPLPTGERVPESVPLYAGVTRGWGRTIELALRMVRTSGAAGRELSLPVGTSPG